MADPVLDPNAPWSATDPDQPTPPVAGPTDGTPVIDPNAPFSANPPLSDWPGVIGRTFEHALAPMGYGQYALGQTMTGQPVLPYNQFMSSAPPERQYSGWLGQAQAQARALSDPITASFYMVSPGASMGATAATEWARQHGWGPLGQFAAGTVGGYGVGEAENLIRAGLEGLIREAPTAASDAGKVADYLARQAGFARPASPLPSEMKAAAGNVVRNEAGEDLAGTTTYRQARAKALKKRAAKAAVTAPDARTDYLGALDSSPNGEAAMNYVLANPSGWVHLSPKAQSAIGAWFAHNINEAPAEGQIHPWVDLDSDQRRLVVPNPAQRLVLDQAAWQAAHSKAKDSGSQGSMLNLLGHVVRHHFLRRAGVGASLAALMHHYGMPFPYAEAIPVAGAGAVHLASRAASRPLALRNMLIGGIQSGGQQLQNELNAPQDVYIPLQNP